MMGGLGGLAAGVAGWGLKSIGNSAFWFGKQGLRAGIKYGPRVPRMAARTAVSIGKRGASMASFVGNWGFGGKAPYYKMPNGNWTFNEPMRSKIFAGAAILSTVGAVKSAMYYKDPRVPTYDEADYSGVGATGSLGLSMYYNNR